MALDKMGPLAQGSLPAQPTKVPKGSVFLKNNRLELRLDDLILISCFRTQNLSLKNPWISVELLDSPGWCCYHGHPVVTVFHQAAPVAAPEPEKPQRQAVAVGEAFLWSLSPRCLTKSTWIRLISCTNKWLICISCIAIFVGIFWYSGHLYTYNHILCVHA